MRKLAPFVVASLVAAFLTGCGGGSGVRFSDLFDDSAAAEGTGVQFTGLVRAVVILATHDASQHQRAVAEQNGRRAVAKLKTRIAAAEKAPAPVPHTKTKTHPHKAASTATAKTKTKPGTGVTPKPSVATQPEPEPAAAPEPAPKPKPAPKLPRIIAVATEKDEHTDRRAAKAVMLYDTHAEKIIGNKVYDIESEPRTGEEVRFETYSTSYVGASL